MPLILGPYVFTDFAIPERVPLGGEQRKATHELLGGKRVVDAMGPSESDISWSGRFQGADAFVKASAIDAMRLAGVKVPLIIDASFRTVLITEFKYNYERFYQITYTITVHVVDSLTLATLLTSLAGSVASDLNAATGAVASFVAGA